MAIETKLKETLDDVKEETVETTNSVKAWFKSEKGKKVLKVVGIFTGATVLCYGGYKAFRYFNVVSEASEAVADVVIDGCEDALL